jgi:nucleotide-binding universal stress UspA family protein
MLVPIDFNEPSSWERVFPSYEEILEVADQIDADLILMASHKPSAKIYLLGSNAAQVVRHA